MRINWVKQGLGGLAVAVGLFVGKPVLAEEIPWLTDYARARGEAQGWNRPLLISFGSKDSPTSQKMYETTLRDPIAIGIITREFVCCKVDAEQDNYLIPRLKIQVVPTLIFAAPDGTILHRVEGLDEANRISMHIDDALRRLLIHEEVKRTRAAVTQAVGPAPQEQPQSPYTSAQLARPSGNPPSYWYPAQGPSTPNYPASNYKGPIYFSTNYFTPDLPSC